MEIVQLLSLAICATTAAGTPTENSRNPAGHHQHHPQLPTSCGVSFTTYPTASSSGVVACSPPVPSPSLNARLRIEGDEASGTIFEGCVVAGPRYISTNSSGSGVAHTCDGTNAGANASPGTVPTAQLDAAAALAGFGYDGDWYPDFEDFLITRIAGSAQTDARFWGILVNGEYTPTGGCQFQVGEGDETLFAFDAFGKDAVLKISPEYAVAEAGRGSVGVTVSDAITGNPQKDVEIAGALTDERGRVDVEVPEEPGCYRLKAEREGALRSDTFYLTVVRRFERRVRKGTV